MVAGDTMTSIKTLGHPCLVSSAGQESDMEQDKGHLWPVREGHAAGRGVRGKEGGGGKWGQGRGCNVSRRQMTHL